MPTRELLPSQAQLPRLGSRKISFRPDIQGLRAVAVLLVVLYHARLPGLSGGYVGVDVFFVISGFLITAHLLSTLGQQGRVDWADFIAKRVRRILPASTAVLILTVVAAYIAIPPLALPPVLKDAVGTALYVPNFLFASRRVDYLSDPNPSVFQHYWSLGVEEQFYLVWPLFLVIAYAIFRGRPRGILTVLIITFIISISLCLWLTQRAQPWAFFMMPTRAWEFAAGGIIAFIVTSTRSSIPAPVARLTSWLGLTLLVGSAVLFDDETTFPGFAALLPVAATALVILSGPASTVSWSASRVLARSPLVFVGAVSYSFYLVHWPMLVIPQIAYSDRHLLPVSITLALAAASFPIAWLVHASIENPARSWRFLNTRRPRVTLSLAVAVTILVAVPLSGAAQTVETQRLHTNRLAPADSSLQRVSATPFVPANLSPGLRDASSDNPATYANGCHLSWEQTTPVECSVGSAEAPITVALFGDSHAAHWFPAFAKIAEEGAIELKNHTKSSCPSAEIPIMRLGVPYAECQVWRSAVVRELVQNPPDVIVLSNSAEGAGDPSDSSFAQAWGKAIEQTIARISEASEVIVIADTPHFEVAPSVCLSAHLTEAFACGASPEHALWPAIFQAERAAALENGGYVANLNTALCSASLCPAIIANLLVYRDSHHLTATFAESQAPALLKEINSVKSAPRHQGGFEPEFRPDGPSVF